MKVIDHLAKAKEPLISFELIYFYRYYYFYFVMFQLKSA